MAWITISTKPLPKPYLKKLIQECVPGSLMGHPYCNTCIIEQCGTKTNFGHQLWWLFVIYVMFSKNMFNVGLIIMWQIIVVEGFPINVIWALENLEDCYKHPIIMVLNEKCHSFSETDYSTALFRLWLTGPLILQILRYRLGEWLRVPE